MRDGLCRQITLRIPKDDCYVSRFRLGPALWEVQLKRPEQSEPQQKPAGVWVLGCCPLKCLLVRTPLLTLSLLSAWRLSGNNRTQQEDQPLEFQGSSAPFSSPLILISSFRAEHGSRIAAFKAISAARFFSFPAPLHTRHRNVGNNRDVETPIITTVALCVLFLFSLFLFFFF